MALFVPLLNRVAADLSGRKLHIIRNTRIKWEDEAVSKIKIKHLHELSKETGILPSSDSRS